MAKHKKIRPEILAKIHAELSALDRGAKTERAEKAAELFGISVATLYRHFQKAGLGDRETRNSKAEKPVYREWVNLCMALVLKSPDGKPIALIDARAAALEAGLLPAEAGDIHIETFHRIAREMGYREDKKKVNRLAAEYAHQAVLFDASTSNYFSVVKELDDGDFLLKLNPRPHADYKNKPVGKDRLRVIIYSFWDMFSGYQYASYTTAKGENGYDAMAAFIQFCEAKNDSRDPVYGLPEQFWADNGPISKLGASVDLITRLGIDIKKGQPYEKERMGGVERTHRSRWGFERTFYMWLTNAEGASGYAKGEIKLSELNARCASHRARLNSHPARWQPTKTKLQAWQLSAADRAKKGNPIRRLPGNAIETMATEVRRRVGRDGVFQWDNQFYEVDDGIHSRWVTARRSLEEPGKIVVEDIETGKRFGCKAFQPRKLGEYRAFPKTIVDEAKEIGASLSVAPPYSADTAPNVLAFPARTAEPAHLPNPLEAGKYATLGEALRAFMDWHGMPDFASQYPDEFDTVVDLIQSNSLSKEYVRTLALELRQAVKAEGQ
jgi:hypothetical protein